MILKYLYLRPVFMLLVLTLSPVSAVETASTPAAQAQALAAEIDQLRQQTHETQAAWQQEQQRLEAEADTYQALIDHEQQQLQTQQERLAQAQDQLTQLQTQQAEINQALAQATAAVKEGEEQRQSLITTSLLGLGLSPEETGEGSGQLAERWAALLQAIDDDARRARLIQRRIHGGWLDDTQQAVEVLQIGAAAAWWQSLDGQQGGLASRNNEGRLILQPAPSQAAAAAIAQAFALHRGKGVPQPLALPVLEQP